MPDITEPNELPLPVQPFVPGMRPKKVLKPLGPVRRGLVKVPTWLFALILCLPALGFTAVKETPVPLRVTGDVLLLAALFFAMALRRLRFKHMLAMLGWLSLVCVANVAVGLAMGLFNADVPWVGPTLGAIFGEFIEYGWLIGGVITVLMVGLGEMFCTGRRSWRAVFWLVVASVIVTTASTLIHETLFRTGAILAPTDAFDEGRYVWVGPIFATIRAVLTWWIVPMTLRIASVDAKKQRVRLAVTSGGLLVAYAVFFLVLPIAPPNGLTVSKETTLLTEPLNPSGTVNYVEAVNLKHSEGVTPENNAAIPLLRTMGLKEFGISSSVRERFLKRLGAKDLVVDDESDRFLWRHKFLEHLEEELRSQSRPTTRMQTAIAELRDHSGTPDNLEVVLARKPWREDEQPALAAYIRRMEKPLSRFVEASRRSRYWVPLVSETDPPTFVDVNVPQVNHVMSMANTMAVRAMLKLGNDDIEGAIEDVLAMHRMARLVGQGAMPVEVIVAYAIDDAAANTSAALARSGKASATRLKRLARDVWAMGALREIDHAMKHEIYMGLDSVELLRRGYSLMDGMQRTSLKKQIDSDEILRMIRFWQEGVLGEWFSDDYRPHEGESTVAGSVLMDEALDRFQERYQPVMLPWQVVKTFIGGPRATRIMVSRAIGHMLVTFTIPAIGYARFVAHKRAALGELGIITLAIEAYRLVKGRPPKSLADLVPEYLPKLPSVQLSKHPVRYVVREDGTYKLQSTQWQWGDQAPGSLGLGKSDLVPDEEPDDEEAVE